MNQLRIFLKAAILLVLILAYVFVSLFWRLWTKNIIKRRHHYVRTVSFFCRTALKVMNIQVRVLNIPPRDQSYFLVGNHLGLLDIFVLSSIHPSLFVTSVDMRETPGLGFLTDIGGCLYVERRSRQKIASEIEEIREALKQKFSVVLYPEGTSSNGERVLPFKKSLLSSAAGTGVPIKPVVINYRRVNGEPMSHKWRDFVFWYGDQTFPPYALRILSVQSAEVEIEFGDEVHVQSEEQRREIAAHLQSIIESKFTPVPVP